MTKTEINPGVCGFTTIVKADSQDGQTVTISAASGCKAVQNMMKAVGNSFDAFELCLAKPGTGALYEYARQNFPGHCACPVIAGIIKTAEAECHLALPRDCSIRFLPAEK
jgi:hypothetical protein